ncbi:MAG: hypothetical protein CMK27_00560 [Porticoccaceae bacterium]|jgi:hypothetical protein|nr:hypothetical protein [Porticoccaceae bacterium]|tara:strand:- start:2395 stop:2811 length:417 start_codon:yes stop_codon:yes gene_type:complete
MLEQLIKPASDIIGKFVKDKDLQAKLDHELQTLFHQANMAQIEILKEDAKSKNWFQNSWRPSVGWICSIALGVHFIILPLAEWAARLSGINVDLPEFDFTQLSTILMAMLGMSGLRSYDKSNLLKEKTKVAKEIIDPR